MKETVTCEICGKPTTTTYHHTKRCNNCREVERRLDEYLKSPKGLEFVRKQLPKLDDWTDGKPGWDYEAVLRDNSVTVVWCDTLVDGDGGEYPCPPDLCGWSLGWANGTIHIGQTTEVIAREGAALFVSLWLRGVSASFCDKLMDGYISHLELQSSIGG